MASSLFPLTPTSRAVAPATRRHIGHLSTFPPRKCGLATFAAALGTGLGDAGATVVGVTVREQASPRGIGDQRHELVSGSASSAREVARVLSRCDATIVQHEFGIFGGRDGEDFVELMTEVSSPIVVVLHTVPAAPTRHQRDVLEAVAARASGVVVMTAAARDRLLDGYDVDASKVVIIPHGAWKLPESTGRAIEHGAAPLRLLTWGLLGPGKGIERVIRALARLGPRNPPIHYTVAGVTHPNVFARDGDRYLRSLRDLVERFDLGDHVHFDDGYRTVPELARFVGQADVVVLPYDSRDQVTSGVLVDAIAAGRPVIATAFPHATELLANGAGIVVPHDDADALVEALRTVSRDPAARAAMAERARDLAPGLAWSAVSAQFLDLVTEITHTTAVEAS